MVFSSTPHMTQSNENSEASTSARKKHAPDTTWHCREPWFGDSRDGQLINGEGYHYFQMKGDGHIEKAIEWYESDDGEEHTSDVPELVGLNWYEFFGYDDDEILETVPSHEFSYIENLTQNSKK